MIAAQSRSILSKARLLQNRSFSTPPSFLQADTGKLATRGHHNIMLALGVLTPVYFIMPEKYTEGAMGKFFGVVLSGTIAAHSWIGLNYVATDYVPKVSKALLGPARYVNFGLAVVTFIGMSMIAVASPGGIKGVVKGVWNPKPKKNLEF